jgi:5-formyltetrahydrofolate cyclo-ligase
MAVPRLREEKPSLRLDPAEIDDFDRATTVGGSAEIGVPVAPEEMTEIDLIVGGSVQRSQGDFWAD